MAMRAVVQAILVKVIRRHPCFWRALSITFSSSVYDSSSVAIYGLNTYADAVAENTNAFGSSVAVSYTVPSGGGSIVFEEISNNPDSCTWSGGATSDYQGNGGGLAADYARTNTTGSLTVTCTLASSAAVQNGLCRVGPQ